MLSSKVTQYASEYASKVDGLMWIIMGISVFLLVGITAVMIYFVIKYHHKKHPNPIQTHGNVLIETVWIVIPTILVIGMFWIGYIDFENIRTTPDNEVQNNVDIRASMWKWTFEYKNGSVIDSFLYVPNKKTTKLHITSMDVLHSFFMPAFRIKEDAVHGQKTYIVFTPNIEFEKGETQREFQVQCAEYCGLNHSYMNARVVVMEESVYEKWFAENAKKEEPKVEATLPEVKADTVETAENEVK